MKKLLLIAALSIAACSSTDNSKYDLVITNVAIIDGTGGPVSEKMNIYVNDGVIVSISEEQLGTGLRTLDGTNKYLIPGLIDCHTHPNPIDETFPQFIHYGVTTIFVTGCNVCTDEVYDDMRTVGMQDSLPAPRVVHTSQIFTMVGKHPVKTYPNSRWVDGKTIHYLTDTLQIEALVKKVAEQPILGIKVTIEDGPAPPFVDRIPQEFLNKIVIEAAKYGLEVFGHVSDNTELEMARIAGIQNLVHFTGVNIDWDNYESEIDEMIADSVSWATTLMIDKSFLYPVNQQWITQEMKEIFGEKEIDNLLTPRRIEIAKNYLRILSAEYNVDEPSLENFIFPQVYDLRRLYEKGCNVALGTDVGNTFIFPGYSMHEEMQLMEMGGLRPTDIIRMATLNGARMLNIADSIGSIEVGKYADMLLLNSNPMDSISNTRDIKAVIKNGIIQKRITMTD